MIKKQRSKRILVQDLESSLSRFFFSTPQNAEKKLKAERSIKIEPKNIRDYYQNKQSFGHNLRNPL